MARTRKKNSDRSADEIRRLTEEWLKRGGREELAAALSAAEEANQILWKEVRIDPMTMNKPVTV
jgi:hypothetical protein